MSYDIYFVRRDPGQSFEDALDELEGTFEDGDLGELEDADLEQWEALLPKVRELLGELDVDDSDDATRELVARESGIELTMIQGELAIRLPEDSTQDSLELMTTVYALARTVEDVTGLEGYDPQSGEPVSARLDEDSPTRRHWPDDQPDDFDAGGAPAPRRTAPEPVGDPRPEMAPDPAARPRRWWEFWRA